MRKSQRSRVSGGGVVEEGYLHVDSRGPVRFSEHETADMATEEHAEFAPSPADALRLHHQLAGQRNVSGGDLGGGRTSTIECTGLGSRSSDAIVGKD